MNFLHGCLFRLGRRSTVYSHDAVKVTQTFNGADDKPYHLNPISSGRNRWLYKYNAENFRVVSSLPTMWTQVRFNNRGCQTPRLHRDMEFPNFDHYRKDGYKDVRKTTWGLGDGKPGFVYVFGVFGFVCGAYAAKSTVFVYVTYMAAAADVLAMASIEVDLTKVQPGACVTFKWRGKPLFVKNRTPHEQEVEEKTPLSSLRDPETPAQRLKDLNWLIVIGICTHLGCVPMAGQGDFVGGFYCPCHGSHFDNCGRVRKGPAPSNLVVPPYEFLSETVVRVG